MSEDEIIERVSKFINITVLYGKTYGMTCDDLKKYQQVFQGLLDLYKKEKEKNEELEKKLKVAKQLYNDSCICIATECVEKDKIRELLKVIQKEKDIAVKNILEKDYNLAENGAICQELGYIEGKLKELLEEK